MLAAAAAAATAAAATAITKWLTMTTRRATSANVSVYNLAGCFLFIYAPALLLQFQQFLVPAGQARRSNSTGEYFSFNPIAPAPASLSLSIYLCLFCSLVFQYLAKVSGI